MATILLVDDDDTICRIISTHLSRRGHTVLRAADGAAALAIATQHIADIALIDQLLPGISGRVLIQRLRANPCWRNIPLVAMSGMGQTYLNAVQEASATLAKPFSLRSLDELIARLLTPQTDQGV